MNPFDDIDAAIALAEAETGAVTATTAIPVTRVTRPTRGRPWTEDDNRFIEENNGKLSKDEMSVRLGRSRDALKIHISRDMDIEAPSRSDKILSAEQVGIGLGMDSKLVGWLIDNGVLPGRRLPMACVMRVVDRIGFVRWLLNPENWIYFKVKNVAALKCWNSRRIMKNYDYAFWGKARKLLVKARKKWKDAWLTPSEAGEICCVGKNYCKDSWINAAIHKGLVKAVRWGNWWILKSSLPGKKYAIDSRGKIVRRDLYSDGKRKFLFEIPYVLKRKLHIEYILENQDKILAEDRGHRFPVTRECLEKKGMKRIKLLKRVLVQAFRKYRMRKQRVKDLVMKRIVLKEAA